MPSSLVVTQAKTPNDQLCFYPLWLRRVSELLMEVVFSAYYLVLFVTVMTITLGAPYLHYKLYRHDGNETDSSERYSQMVEELDTLWDQYYKFLLPILPVLFPMVSLSGVSACSIAGFVATITFTVGAAGVATKIIFKVKAKALHNQHAINEWRRASETPWRRVPNKSFWILFSLPTVIFFLSIGLLISTVILTLWERPIAGMAPRSETPGCTIMRLQAFGYTFLTMLVVTFTHFAFIIIKLHLLTARQTVEHISAV